MSLTCGHKQHVFPRVNSVAITACVLHPYYKDAQQPCQHLCQHFLYKLVFISWLTKCQMHVLLPLSWTERCEKQCFSAPSNWRELLAEFQKSRSDDEAHVTEGISECLTSELILFSIQEKLNLKVWMWPDSWVWARPYRKQTSHHGSS